MKSSKKGFTLIELLVVIAIIGILAAIVFVNVTSARAKAKDAAVKGNLSSFATASELIYDTANSYATVCTAGTGSKLAYDAAVAASGKTANLCYPAASTYVACVEMSDATNSWCTDSTGAKKLILKAGCTGTPTACPAT